MKLILLIASLSLVVLGMDAATTRGKGKEEKSSQGTCPDKRTRCGDSQTCCALSGGGYGCCPYQGGVCCSDMSHCCPHGSTCDIQQSKCIPSKSKERIPTNYWAMIYESFTKDELAAQHLDEENGNGTNSTFELGNKQCGSGEQTCPDTYTCCLLSTGGYGCCPFNNGVCCPDKIHCCPNGKICDDAGKRCL